jgi:hypothetical protein
MQIQIELTEESRELLSATSRRARRCTRFSPALSKMISRSHCLSSECDLQQATELLEMARDHCPQGVEDIEHAIFAATAG